MPRIRTIKPEFWSSPSTAQASAVARLAYIAMWNWADDYGRGTANLKELEGFIFPNDDVETLSQGNSRNFLDVVQEVADVFDVTFYEVSGRPYFVIHSWDRHQVTQRRAKSKFPPLEEAETVLDLGSTGKSRKFLDAVKEVAANPRIGTGEQGNRGTGDIHTPSNADRELDDAASRSGAPGGACSAEPSDRDRKRRSRYSTRFEEWYQHWPRKVGKREAARAFDAALKRVGFDELVDATKRHAEAWRQAGTETRFIPHPATWLRRDGWDDELDAPKNAREGASRGSSDGSRPSDWLGGFDASGGDLGPFVIDQPPLDERSDP